MGTFIKLLALCMLLGLVFSVNAAREEPAEAKPEETESGYRYGGHEHGGGHGHGGGAGNPK